MPKAQAVGRKGRVIASEYRSSFGEGDENALKLNLLLVA